MGVRRGLRIAYQHHLVACQHPPGQGLAAGEAAAHEVFREVAGGGRHHQPVSLRLIGGDQRGRRAGGDQGQVHALLKEVLLRTCKVDQRVQGHRRLVRHGAPIVVTRFTLGRTAAWRRRAAGRGESGEFAGTTR